MVYRAVYAIVLCSVVSISVLASGDVVRVPANYLVDGVAPTVSAPAYQHPPQSTGEQLSAPSHGPRYSYCRLFALLVITTAALLVIGQAAPVFFLGFAVVLGVCCRALQVASTAMEGWLVGATCFFGILFGVALGIFILVVVSCHSRGDDGWSAVPDY